MAELQVAHALHLHTFETQIVVRLLEGNRKPELVVQPCQLQLDVKVVWAQFHGILH